MRHSASDRHNRERQETSTTEDNGGRSSVRFEINKVKDLFKMKHLHLKILLSKLTWHGQKEANKIIMNTSVLSKFILNGAGESKRIEERESLTSVISTLWRRWGDGSEKLSGGDLDWGGRNFGGELLFYTALELLSCLFSSSSCSQHFSDGSVSFHQPTVTKHYPF